MNEYKKMYEIEVENKANILTFYEEKMSQSQKDKETLLKKYESLAHQSVMMNQNLNSHNQTPLSAESLPKGLNFDQSHYSQNQEVHHNQTDPKTLQNESRSYSSVSQPQVNAANANDSRRVQKANRSLNQTEHNISVQSRNVQKSLSIPHSGSKKIIQINSSRSKEANSRGDFIVKPYNKGSSHISSSLSRPLESTNLNYQTPYKSFQKEINSNNDSHSYYRDEKAALQSFNQESDVFLKLVRNIFHTLQNQKIKSEDLKSCKNIRRFSSVESPTHTQIMQILTEQPLAVGTQKIGTEGLTKIEIEQSIDRIREYLIRKYDSFSGNLFIELIIDKLEDLEIAYEVNQDEDAQIIEGLSGFD